MVAADHITISLGRAQDWINTVINPVLDGVRRELRFLPSGPWRWQPTTRSFEFFLPAKEYVPYPFGDNYDDFIEKYRAVGEALDLHDRLLATFTAEFERSFGILSSDRGSFKNELEAVAPPDLRDWFVSYVAGGFERLPDYYTGHDLYNARADVLLATGRGVLGQSEVDTARIARELADHDAKLERQLISVRRDLADLYGARVRPS